MTRKRQYTVREKVLKDLKINKSVLYMANFIKRVDNGEQPSDLKRSMGIDYKTTQKFLALIPEIKEGWEKSPDPIGKENFSAREQFKRKYPWEFNPTMDDMGRPIEETLKYTDLKIEDINRYDDLQELEKLVPEHLWSVKHLTSESINLGVDYLSEYHKLNARRIAHSGIKEERNYVKVFREYKRFVYMHLEVFFKTTDPTIPKHYFNLAMEFALESFSSGDRNLLTRAKLMVSYRIWLNDNNLERFRTALTSYTNDARVTNRAVEQIEKTIEEETEKDGAE